MPAKLFTTTVALVALLLLGSTGCNVRGYAEGSVTSSQVTYSYQAPPVITEPSGVTYMLTIDGLDATQSPVLPSLARAGIERVERSGDLAVTLRFGPVSAEPGSVGLFGAYYASLDTTVPYEVTIRYHGKVVKEHADSVSEQQVVKSKGSFSSREDAATAAKGLRELFGANLDQRWKEEALDEAIATTDRQAATTLQPRTMHERVAAIRKAGDVSMEQAFTLLQQAERPADLTAAYEAYATIGTGHRHDDGSPNKAADYGVLCGMAACKMLAGELKESYALAKQAGEQIPEGEEASSILLALYRQEQRTGVEILPEEDRARAQRESALLRLFER